MKNKFDWDEIKADLFLIIYMLIMFGIAFIIL
jgi:hypothetical protein